jgi:hypothetical protein
MVKNIKIILAAISPVLVFPILAGCSVKEDFNSVFMNYYAALPATYNPGDTTDGNDYEFQANLYEPLIYQDRIGKIQGGLATDASAREPAFSIANDEEHETKKFTLRTGMKYVNYLGNPIPNAVIKPSDIIYSMAFALNPLGRNSINSLYGGILGNKNLSSDDFYGFKGEKFIQQSLVDANKSDLFAKYDSNTTERDDRKVIYNIVQEAIILKLKAANSFVRANDANNTIEFDFVKDSSSYVNDMFCSTIFTALYDKLFTQNKTFFDYSSYSGSVSHYSNYKA